jgi:hypothetical protein
MLERHRTRMNISTFFFSLLMVAIFGSGCDRSDKRAHSAEQISYYDKNGDGKVDVEFHEIPGAHDANWELADTNHDGRYDRKTVWGVGVFQSAVDIPVATNVQIKPFP